MKTIKLTKLELQGIIDAASQMEDDFYDWMKETEGPQKAKTHTRAFESAMRKLREAKRS